MNELPAWLPECLIVDPWTNDQFDKLYAVFTRDFKEKKLTYDGREVWFFLDMEDGKESIFWHLTGRQEGSNGDRYPDFRRCERLCWARAMIENAAAEEILAWDYKEGDGSIKTYVWLKDHDFLVIMKKMKNGSRRLITSFGIDQENYRRKLKKKYDSRIP